MTNAGFDVDELSYYGEPIESAAMLINVALSKTVLNWIRDRRLAAIAVIFLPPFVFDQRAEQAAQGIPFDGDAEEHLRLIEGGAASPLCVGVDGRLAGLLGLADPIRPEAASVVKTLREQGIKEIVMLTGDRAPVAAAVAARVGIERFVAEVFPGDKLAAVQQLQAEGYKVAVVGDGINDSPALKQADVGIAVNGGTALAQETADVVILQGDLHKLLDALAIAREGVGIIRQNWKIIRTPNTIGLGLAFLGLLNPVSASLISDGASLAAGANSLRPVMGRAGGRA